MSAGKTATTNVGISGGAPAPAANSGEISAQPAGGGSFDQRLRQLFRGELLVPAALVFLLSLPVFSRLIGAPDVTRARTDHFVHLNLAKRLAMRGESPPHPLYHYFIVFLSLGRNLAAFEGVAAFVLAFALGVRAYLTALLFSMRNEPRLWQTIVVCLALALAMPLPNWWQTPRSLQPQMTEYFLKRMPAPGWWDLPSVSRGQVAANAWHNPTVIFAMPFCLLLFILGLQSLHQLRASWMAGVGGVMVVSLLAKPNYALAFAPCFAVAAGIVGWRERRAGRLSTQDLVWRGAVALGPALAVLGLQYRGTFAAGQAADARVVFAPLAAWGGLMPVHTIPFAILLGLAFPLAVAVLYRSKAVREPKLLLASAVLAVAILQYALLAETGPRAEHGNFGWGVLLANQVLFVACADFLLRQPASNARRAGFGVLGLHVLSGCICLTRGLFVPDLVTEY
jgi:hypothetical protein